MSSSLSLTAVLAAEIAVVPSGRDVMLKVELKLLVVLYATGLDVNQRLEQKDKH